MRFSLLGPYQRFWEDVEEWLEHWAEVGLSLRRMQAELSASLATPIGLRALNERPNRIKQSVMVPLSSVPPVVLLDAIWVTVLRPTGQYRKDKRGQVRPVKQKHKVPVLVALGVWLESGHWEVLDWKLAEKEDAEGWETLLVRLEARGVHRERGLELVIHDGGKGLIAALKRIYLSIPRQRCIFHKLRNLWQAIAVPEGLSGQQARDFRRPIIRQAAAIYRAETLQQACALRDAFRDRWRTTHPDVVLALERDWHETVTFYRLLQRFHTWRSSSLRTTSLLDRINRKLRRLFRSANAYHSDLGLLAAVSRVLSPLRAV